MTDRDETLNNLRPKFALNINGKKNDIELFMHTVLRPILKYQNEFIQIIITEAKHFEVEKTITDNESRNQAYLNDFIKKNTNLRNLLIGSIIGLFTSEELKTYFNYSTQLNKRIIEMIVTRYLSSK